MESGSSGSSSSRNSNSSSRSSGSSSSCTVSDDDDDTIEYDIEIVASSSSSSCDSLAFLPAQLSDPPQPVQSPQLAPPPPPSQPQESPPQGAEAPTPAVSEFKLEQAPPSEAIAFEAAGQAVAANTDKSQESRVDIVDGATGADQVDAVEIQLAEGVNQCQDEIRLQVPSTEDGEQCITLNSVDNVEISANQTPPEVGCDLDQPIEASRQQDLNEEVEISVETNPVSIDATGEEGQPLDGLKVVDAMELKDGEPSPPEEAASVARLELEIDLTAQSSIEVGPPDSDLPLQEDRAPTMVSPEQPQPIEFEKLIESSKVELLQLDGPIEQLVVLDALQVVDARRIEQTHVQVEVPALEKQEILLETVKQPEVVLTEAVADPIGRRQHPLAALIEGEDLEREFDEEPPFERRQVSVKRNQNPRQEYQLEGEIGRGKFGTVYRCQELASGRKLAAKFVHMRRKEDREDVEREVAIMSRLQHKRLLQLYDAFDDGLNEMCLITELVEGGELFERIVDDDFELTEKKAAIFMRQICEGVHYMHSQQIVHLDMKPENILCMSRTGNRVKLIDFGLARQLDPKDPLRVMFGTPDFAAPEVLAYDTVSLATDMWSVGVICYVLLSGLSPFMGDNDMETMANVTRATYDFDDAAFEPISDLAKDFIAKLLVREQDKRLKPDECLQHAWLQRGGAQLEASVRERRESIMSELDGFKQADLSPQSLSVGSTPPLPVSLDKRNLKKYVVKRKWHKTVHAIMALGRMGANLKLKRPT